MFPQHVHTNGHFDVTCTQNEWKILRFKTTRTKYSKRKTKGYMDEICEVVMCASNSNMRCWCQTHLMEFKRDFGICIKTEIYCFQFLQRFLLLRHGCLSYTHENVLAFDVCLSMYLFKPKIHYFDERICESNHTVFMKRKILSLEKHHNENPSWNSAETLHLPWNKSTEVKRISRRLL